MQRGFITPLVFGILTSLSIGGIALAIHRAPDKVPADETFGVAPRVFTSDQVGTSATDGYVLQTNGATSTWVATSTLGISGSGTGHDPVTLSGTPDYITLSGQDIIRGTVDVSDDTNATAGDAITLNGDDFDFDGGATPAGELGGTWASPTIDDSLAVTSWNLTTPTLTSFFGTPCTGNDFLQDISDTGAFTCVTATGGSSEWTDAGDYLYPTGGEYASSPRFVATSTSQPSSVAYRFGVGTTTPWEEVGIQSDNPYLEFHESDVAKKAGIGMSSGDLQLFTYNAGGSDEIDFLTDVDFNGYEVNSSILPLDDSQSLGGISNAWSDLYLGAAGAIYFNDSDVIVTESGNRLRANGVNLLIGADIDTSSELITIVTDETGTGRLVFSGSPAFSGTATFANLTATGTASSTNLSISNTATTTNLVVNTNFRFGGVTGNSWDDYCVSITGAAGLCDGSDDGGGGGSNWTDAGDYLYPTGGEYVSFPYLVATGTATSSIAGKLTLGSGSAAGILESTGSQDLRLQTGNPTTGNITITDGAAGNITISPNGSGKVVVDNTIQPTVNEGADLGASGTSFSNLYLGSDSLIQFGSGGTANYIVHDAAGGAIQVGTGSAAGRLESQGNQDLVIATGNSTTGTITLVDGANGDFFIVPNGTGEVGIGTSTSLVEKLEVYDSTTANMVEFTNGNAATTGAYLSLFHDSISPAVSDSSGLEFNARDSAGGKEVQVAITTEWDTTTNGAEDGLLNFFVTSAGTTYTDGVRLNKTDFSPHTNDGTALGSAVANQWSDLFLAEGAVINFDNGDLTLTQTNNDLTLAGGGLNVVGMATSTSLTVTGLTSALTLTGANGTFAEYAGSGTCTNQFVTVLSALGVATCASVTSAAITDGTITEPDLDADNSPNDTDYLQYDSTGTNFIWRSIANVVADLEADIETALDTLTSLVTVTISTTLTVPFGAACDSNADGEICQDTSDNQLIVDGLAVQTQGIKIWGTTIASTSSAFISGGLLPVATELDGYTITRIQCHVTGGTSKIIAIEDGSANSSEDITCATTNTTDDGSITNATYTASELQNIDFGATSGSVNYVTISVFGTWTRD